MKIATEPIGSIPRPVELITAITSSTQEQNLEALYDKAIVDTLKEFEKTGSLVITDGEQTKSSFATYPLDGALNIAPEGMRIDFADGHFRQLPLLTKGPFRYSKYAVQYLKYAQERTNLPIKQAVISASALSLIYPPEGIEGYSQETFIADLVNECEKDIRQCLEQGAAKVQMDFTEGRLSLKLDPSGGVLQHFINLNNQVFNRFSDAYRERLGVHVCPGGDHDSTHSADVDYTAFLPALFDLNVGNFYLQLASESDKKKVLKTVKEYLKPYQKVFIGVTDVNNPKVETKEEVMERVLEAAEFIPVAQLGTTDDCGFSPFCDDVSTTREIAFAKIKARVEGTKLAEEKLSKT
ncbi:uroporphyrinogen decarboxylase/cobalamine-independent methonine synthase family protein [Echinicola shivajiensis]|uniref:5-methyltetrahydropteroyltriglutamate-- homocysteine methyltransferase n=1 Tax=Echinicola shivajiensis TaxID=1035916 RepID=UPI001BFC9A5F|nr:5-methyltetrahydropteroyltriglutamate--homocysteine methyltransferase [Echinicola shivajiensis]